jgi:hypothetical protein
MAPPTFRPLKRRRLSPLHGGGNYAAAVEDEPAQVRFEDDLGWSSFYKLQPAGEIELETLGTAALVRVRAIRPCRLFTLDHTQLIFISHISHHSTRRRW